MKPYLLCAAVLALGACATQPAPLGPAIPDEPAGPALSAPDVQALVVGNTGTGTMSGSNATYAMYVMPGGRAELKRPTGIEDGNWQITPDGKFCVKWELFRGGEDYCQRIYKDGPIYKFRNENSVELLTFQAGRQL
jgi:putative hemolysin